MFARRTLFLLVLTYFFVRPALGQEIRHFTASIPMSDGVSLAADVYLPNGAGPFDAVLIRTPYGRDGYDTAYAGDFAEGGYVLVVQSVRGTGGSGGRFVPFVHERQDGVETADWITGQSWSSGDIGLYGPSYSSYAGLMLASADHPSVRAVVNVSGWVDPATMIYPGGAFHLQLSLPWNLYQLGLLNDETDWDALFRRLPITEAIQRPDGTVHPAWRASMTLMKPGPALTSMGLEDRTIDVPVLHITGWHDFVYRSTLEAFEMIDAPQRLVVGPWYHDQQKTTNTRVGGEDFGPAAAYGWSKMHAEALAWFDRYMSDDARPEQPPVRLFVMGHNEWREFDSWPPHPSEPRRLYLTDGGRLDEELPANARRRAFTYDPNDPVPTVGGVNFHFFPENLGPLDQNSIAEREDVLTFESAVLEDTLDLIGPIRAVVYASADHVDADFTAKLIVVRPDGFARIVEDGIVRASYRNGLESFDLLTPGEVVRLEIDLGATALQILPGSRIRLDISGGSFPKYDRNSGNGTSSLEAIEFSTIRQAIHFGAAHASFLEFHVQETR